MTNITGRTSFKILNPSVYVEVFFLIITSSKLLGFSMSPLKKNSPFIVNPLLPSMSNNSVGSLLFLLLSYISVKT
jgi:hypothetical protein